MKIVMPFVMVIQVAMTVNWLGVDALGGRFNREDNNRQGGEGCDHAIHLDVSDAGDWVTEFPGSTGRANRGKNLFNASFTGFLWEGPARVPSNRCHAAVSK
jgi:hypothetical protein